MIKPGLSQAFGTFLELGALMVLLFPHLFV
jgi:hypothetical protein